MEFPWRSRPPTGNFCPVCSHSHFPFCIPPPPHYFRPPPPPPDQFFRSPLPPPPPPPQQQASYDPFFDHQGGPSIMPYPPPHPAQIAPRPWNGDPNYSNDYYGNPNSGLDRDTTGQIGTKRMRFDNGSDGHVTSWAEDERRLKLIRDHGAVSTGLDRKYDGESSVSGRSYEPSKVQGIESGYLKEINSSIKQNHGEPQVAYQQSENNKPPHNQNNSVVHNHSYVNSPGSDGYTNLNRSRGNHEIPAYDNSSYQEQRINFPTDSREFNNQFLQSHATQQHRAKAQSSYYGLSNQSDNMHLMPDPQGFKAQPPLPTSPPPPLPVEPPRYRFSEPVASSASGPGSMFPVALDSSTSFRSPYSMVSEAKTSVSSHYSSKGYPNSSGYYPEETHVLGMASSNTFNGESKGFPPRNQLLDKPKVIDASHILKHPHRANRPDHIVIIMRGLPGSGKSYNAKLLRDIEVENGGTAPRIHSMDEYFMTEVEKVEESEGSRSSGSVRGKKSVARKVMEYCYEPEMEEAYRSSMLKAFKKTLDEGAFPFVIVDDRNLRVADFAQFWATAKRSGYEVYILEATYKDPAGCAARNVHSFTKNDILKMADQWEEAPSLYMKLDIKSLLHGDDLEENRIEEVDMDTEDGNNIGDTSSSEVMNTEKKSRPSEDLNTAGPSTDEQKGNGEEHPVEVVKDLGKSKWSNDLDDDDVHKPKAIRGNSSALSSLTKSYSKKGKSVRWADQIGRIGFSISAGKSTNVSLVIGPGTGYNLNSNPLPEEEKLNKRFTGESRRISIFQDQLRAEHESFKAAFDKRKLRIGVLDADEE